MLSLKLLNSSVLLSFLPLENTLALALEEDKVVFAENKEIN